MASPSAIARNSTVHQIQVTLLLNGKKVPVVSCQIEYTLNQIPSALVKIPSGTTIGSSGTLLEPADLQGRKTAKVVVKGVGGNPHPAGISTKLSPSQANYEIEIFDGYILSSSVNVSTSGTSTVLSLTGKLSDLDLSSFAAGDFDKTTPSDWFLSENVGILNGSGPVELVKAGNVAITEFEIPGSDLWNDVCKPAMVYKAQRPLTRFSNDPPSNSAAAITAIESVKSLVGLKFKSDVVTVLNGVPSSRASIHQTFARIVSTGQGGATAFEKIISLFQMFGVVLSPRCKGAEIMQYRPVGAIDDASGAGKLDPKAFDLGTSSAAPVQIPAGAIMYGGGSAIAILGVTVPPEKVDNAFIGQYVPSLSGDYDGGPFVVLKTPQYLYEGVGGKVTSGIFESKKGIVPVYGGSKSANPPKAASADELRPLTDALAQQFYFTKVFATKTQDLMLGFTTSYAPGQRIEYEYPGAKVSGLSAVNTCRGTVESVVYTFSADAAQVNTILRLRHVMNDADIELFGEDATKSFEPLFSGVPAFKNGIIEP